MVLQKSELIFEKIIFGSRWLQAPIYFGLILGGCAYVVQFARELYHILHDFAGFGETEMMLAILTLVDISMVMNLLVVVIIGGYWTFVSRIDIDKHEDKPDWLEKVSSSTLKIKLITSLVGISGVHLLKTFINIDHMSTEAVVLQISVHLVFIISALLLSWADRIGNH